MSRYCEVKTQFKDEAALVDALMETGKWTHQQIEVHQVPQHLCGYRGDERPETAHVIIRKKHIGRLSNDIGFVKNEDGNYAAIISAYDQGVYGERWIGRLKSNYAFHKISREQNQRGRTVTRERLSNGRQRVVVSGYR